MSLPKISSDHKDSTPVALLQSVMTLHVAHLARPTRCFHHKSGHEVTTVRSQKTYTAKSVLSLHLMHHRVGARPASSRYASMSCTRTQAHTNANFHNHPFAIELIAIHAYFIRARGLKGLRKKRDLLSCAVQHAAWCSAAFSAAQRTNLALAAKDGAIKPLVAETGGIDAMVVDSSTLPEQLSIDVTID